MSYFRAENLSLHFGGLRAVDSVSFAVEKGEILSIIGPNGAGKSSIFNLISRIYPPTHGTISFEDQDITQQPAYDIAGPLMRSPTLSLVAGRLVHIGQHRLAIDGFVQSPRGPRPIRVLIRILQVDLRLLLRALGGSFPVLSLIHI